MTIDDFIGKLTEYESSDTVLNMYRGNSENASSCRKNLKKYLEKHQNDRILFVGEAPGWKGCARTGIPFTSDAKEISSKVLREAIEKYSPNVSILMWNAFPFHPHKESNLKSNRKPNKDELLQGKMIMKYFLETFPNIKCVASVGNVAKNLLKDFKFEYPPNHICHPSYGHKNQCESDVYLTLNRFFLFLHSEEIIKEVADAAGEELKEAAYLYLEEHRSEFFEWYNGSDHLEYAYAYWMIHKEINLSEYKKRLEKTASARKRKK